MPDRALQPSKFSLDPEIKQEYIWAGDKYRPSSLLVERKGALVKIREGRNWNVVTQHLSPFDSIFSQFGDPTAALEIFSLRELIRGWRFYDH